MRSPSPRVLTDRVDISAGVKSQDRRAGAQWSYPVVTQSAVACSVQYVETGLDDTTFEALTQVNAYEIFFGSDPGLKPRDQIVWTDPQPNRTLFVQVNPPSEAGRRSTWVVRALEQL